MLSEVFLYEKLGLLTKADRMDNGYRTFTQLQLDQFQLARTAFQIEILQNGLRKKVVEIVKLSTSCEFEKTMEEKKYISLLQKERDQAKEAVNLVEELLKEQGTLDSKQEEMSPLKCKEVSNQLGISMDTLRNWEMNGLIRVKRKWLSCLYPRGYYHNKNNTFSEMCELFIGFYFKDVASTKGTVLPARNEPGEPSPWSD